MKFQLVLRLLALISAILLASCAIPVNTTPQLSDIATKTDFSHIRAMAYMGGSIYYDPADLAGSPVVAGAKIAFRLGQTDRVEVATDRVIYKDRPADAKFGTLRVTSVNTDKISFTFDLYNSEGKSIGSGSKEIALGTSTDIDGDTLPDLIYRKPVPVRVGLEHAQYLEFLSSMNTKNTTMFSLIPEQYASGQYPNGIMGINPNGRFIATKYKGATTGRSLVKGVSYGDYVLDNQKGRYERIISTLKPSGVRTISDTELQTVEGSVLVFYTYQAFEFVGSLVAKNLLGAIPDAIKGQGTETLGEAGALDKLNELLTRKNLIQSFSSIQKGPIPDEALPDVIISINSLTSDQLVQLNRLFLEKSYPSLSPAIGEIQNPLSEVLPLLSCIIENPEAEAVAGTRTATSAPGSRSIAAATASEYDRQRQQIDSHWNKYHSFWSQELDAIQAMKNFFSSGGNSDTSASPSLNPNQDYVVALIPASTAIQTALNPALFKTYTTGPDGKFSPDVWNNLVALNSSPSANDLIQVKMGMYGYFSCTWGNVEAGAAIALYLKADTKVRISSGFQNSIPDATGYVKHRCDDWNINLSLFDGLPIQIGVVTARIALQGGFSLPVEVGASAELSTNGRIAFTGLWGAETKVGANYGVGWNSFQVGWWSFSLPYMYLSPYGSANLVNEMAFYCAPVDMSIVKQTTVLDSTSLYVSVTPSVFLEPRIVFNDLAWVGFRGSVGQELRFQISTQNSTAHLYPDIHGTGSTATVVNVEGKGGISVVVPVFNYRWEPQFSFPVYNGKFFEAQWNAF